MSSPLLFSPIAACHLCAFRSAIDAIAIPATSPITFDGQLTEPVWEQAPSINEFVQREPAEGEAPSQRTDARIAYDEHALYVAVRAYDTEADIASSGC